MGERLAGFTVGIMGRQRELASQPAIIANGMLGADYIADNSTHDGYWTAVQVVADAVFSGSTACNINGLATSSATIPAGTILFGCWTSITLSSGSIVAYQ